jgi:hypothetical protein
VGVVPVILDHGGQPALEEVRNFLRIHLHGDIDVPDGETVVDRGFQDESLGRGEAEDVALGRQDDFLAHLVGGELHGRKQVLPRGFDGLGGRVGDPGGRHRTHPVDLEGEAEGAEEREHVRVHVFERLEFVMHKFLPGVIERRNCLVLIPLISIY